MTAAGKIGVFGGTFDPPHVGHLVAAVNVADQLELRQVLFVVAGTPWQKVGTRPISSAADRMAMVDLALADRGDMVSSPIEMQLGGDAVTATTLEALAPQYPDTELVVIVGSDAAAGMATWRRADELAEMATIAVVDRPGTTGGRPPTPFRFEVVACPLMDISSSDVRERVSADLRIDYLVPDRVRDYVETRGLYRAPAPGVVLS